MICMMLFELVLEAFWVVYCRKVFFMIPGFIPARDHGQNPCQNTPGQKAEGFLFQNSSDNLAMVRAFELF